MCRNVANKSGRRGYILGFGLQAFERLTVPWLLAVLSLVLAACGGPAGRPNHRPEPKPYGTGISGTVTIPDGDVYGTVVFACFSDRCDASLDGHSAGTQVFVRGERGNYAIPLPPGEYTVMALQDADRDGSFATRDYGATYQGIVTVPGEDIDITLVPLAGETRSPARPRFLLGWLGAGL